MPSKISGCMLLRPILHAWLYVKQKRTDLVNEVSVCPIIQLRSLEIDIHAPVNVVTTHSLHQESGRLSAPEGQQG